MTTLLKRFCNEGVEVLYLEQLAAESLTSRNPRAIHRRISEEANIRGRETKKAIRELLRWYQR